MESILADKYFNLFRKDDDNFPEYANDFHENIEECQKSNKLDCKVFIQKVFRRIETEKPFLAVKIIENLIVLGKFETVNLIAKHLHLKDWPKVSPLVKSSLSHLVENIKKNEKTEKGVLINNRIYMGVITAIDEHLFEDTHTIYELYGSVINISNSILIHYFNQDPIKKSELFFLKELSIRFGIYLTKVADIESVKFNTLLLIDFFQYFEVVFQKKTITSIIRTIERNYEKNKELISRPRTPPRIKPRKPTNTTRSLPSSIHEKKQTTWARMVRNSQSISPLTLSLEICDRCNRKKINKDSIWKGNTGKAGDLLRLCRDCKHRALYAPPSPPTP